MMDDLDQLLRERSAPLPVSDALMARILADADTHQPSPPQLARTSVDDPPPHLRLWQYLADLFGGRGVMAGLATAACAGLYLGVAQPAAIGTLALSLAGMAPVDQLEFMPSIDIVLAGE